MQYREANERFNAVFAGKGGLFDHKTEQLNYSSNFDLYMNFIRFFIDITFRATADRNLHNGLPMVVNYIKSDALNASAKKDGNTYYLGICSGAAYLLERLFNTMLANPNNLPHIGDVSKETGSEAIERSLYKSVSSFTANGISLEYNKPNDPTRAALAIFLTLLALGFLAMHELAHILNGHIDYTNTLDNLGLLNGSELVEAQKEQYVIRQTLEFDADSVGISSMVSHCLTLNDDSTLLPDEYRVFTESIDTLIGLACYATYSIYRLFGNDFDSVESMMNHNYPSFEVRRHLLGATVATRVLKEKDIFDEATAQRVIEYIVSYLSFAEHDFSTNKTPEVNGLRETLSNTLLSAEGVEQGNIIKEKWLVIRPQLERFAYRKLAPPDHDKIEWEDFLADFDS
jgi:hypothetical protein